jgi:hypothetical protein
MVLDLDPGFNLFGSTTSYRGKARGAHCTTLAEQKEIGAPGQARQDTTATAVRAKALTPAPAENAIARYAYGAGFGPGAKIKNGFAGATIH